MWSLKRARRRTAAPTFACPEAVAFPFARGARFVGRWDTERKAASSNASWSWSIPRERTFRVAPRKDLENFVAPMLGQLGLFRREAGSGMTLVEFNGRIFFFFFLFLSLGAPSLRATETLSPSSGGGGVVVGGCRRVAGGRRGI